GRDPVAAAGIPPHITVLFPFAPTARVDAGFEADLARLFAATASFPFALDRVGRFPEVLWIGPADSQPFVSLTTVIAERWPQWPPYEGRFPDVVPHLTVAQGPEPPGEA